MAIIDETEVRKTIEVMKPNGQLFEIRIIFGNKQVLSGYFESADDLIKAFGGVRDFANCNVYITLNHINEACFSRTQRNKFESRTKATTSDSDIVGYEWLMVDIDPTRPSDTSSSEAQISHAKQKGNQIYTFMKKIGFYDPLMANSGNGVHLLYKVRLKNDDDNKNLLKKSLETLDMLFGDDDVSVDVKNFNPSRICKLYGTLAQKGTNTEDRPYRMSKIIGDIAEIRENDKEYLKALCSYLPQDEKPQSYNNYSPQKFDLEEWLRKYNIGYREQTWSGGKKFILDTCPFDSNHKGKDAVIFQSSTGAIGFNCFHNSCSDKTWRDVRLLFEPGAYDKKSKYKPNYTPNSQHKEPVKIVEKDGVPIFLTASQIYEMPDPPIEYIPTGIIDIDKKLGGLAKGDLTVISGFSGSGKSSIISQIVLNACDNGFKTIVYSGELRAKRFMDWMYCQAGGKARTVSTNIENYYALPVEFRKKVNEWLGDGFLLYNNKYGNDFVAFKEKLVEQIKKSKADLIILDNLMTFDIRTLSQNKYDAQTQFILELQNICKTHNVHIAFVAHPRKQNGFLRADDISGSGDLRNDADNVLIVHRINEDFRRLSKETFGWNDANPVYDCTNCIEIAKDRFGGTVDYFVRLWFEKESKRLRNSKTENVIYKWDDNSDGFLPTQNMEIPFD